MEVPLLAPIGPLSGTLLVWRLPFKKTPVFSPSFVRKYSQPNKHCQLRSVILLARHTLWAHCGSAPWALWLRAMRGLVLHNAQLAAQREAQANALVAERYRRQNPGYGSFQPDKDSPSAAL